MKSMGQGTGIKLTTGETIGRWSLDDHDGKRQASPSGGEDPATTKLPKAEVAPADGGDDDDEADAFAGRHARRPHTHTHALTCPFFLTIYVTSRLTG